MANRLLLVDAFSQIYRAFFAIRSLTSPAGQPVNALFGFTKMLRRMLTELNPSHVAVVFDCGAPQRRLTALPSYKEHRPPTPPDLEAQLPLIRELLAALRVPAVGVEGEEADDLIATLATIAADQRFDVLIASSDKDFMQLVRPSIRMVRQEAKATIYVNAQAVQTRYGVRPDQIVDFLSLTGDNSDNIRGVPGIGEKTAAELLRRYDTFENLLAAADALERPKLRTTLRQAAPQVLANRQLIALHTELPLPVTLEALVVQKPDTERLRDLFRQTGFNSLLAEFDRIETPTLDLFGGR